MVTVVELAAAVCMSEAPERVARFAGAFAQHDPRTGQLPKRWSGLGMDATFTEVEAERIVADWREAAFGAEFWAHTHMSDAEAGEIIGRYRADGSADVNERHRLR